MPAPRTVEIVDGEMPCTLCGAVKPLNDFPKNRRSRTGHAYRCKPCHSSLARKWNQENLERRREIDRARYRRRHLADKYGITEHEYDDLLARQGGGCAICKAEVAQADGRRLAVDHCHETGQVRGLLCGNCNRAIGLFGDDPAVLRSAAKYLEGR